MLTAVAIIPSAPVLVPDLAGTAAVELNELTAAVRAAVADLPPRWLAVGVGPAAQRFGPAAAGTFAGYGADVPVALSPASGTPAELPLCALMAAWVRGRFAPDSVIETRSFPMDLDNDAAAEQGRSLRAELDADSAPAGVLVVADGCHTLTPPAPGGYDPDAAPVQAALDDALAGGDVTALGALPPGVVGRAAFAVLAGLAGPGPSGTRELYRGAPYGVGYFVGVWRP